MQVTYWSSYYCRLRKQSTVNLKVSAHTYDVYIHVLRIILLTKTFVTQVAGVCELYSYTLAIMTAVLGCAGSNENKCLDCVVHG